MTIKDLITELEKKYQKQLDRKLTPQEYAMMRGMIVGFFASFFDGLEEKNGRKI